MAKNPIRLLRLGFMRTAALPAAESPTVSETTRLRRLNLSEGKVEETLDKWSAEGGAVTATGLMKHVRALCKFRRHKQALAVMDWMEKNDIQISTSNHAFCLGLLSKVRGIDSAENYFSRLSDSAKDHQTYGSLLHCYCRKRMKDEAVTFFKKMKELNLASNGIAYNNLMSLYMRLGDHEKVVELFEEMKANNISPDNCSYRILIDNYAAMDKIDSIEKSIQEMEETGVFLDWFTYCRLAEVYNSKSLFEKAEVALRKAELVTDGQDLAPFPCLIRSYAGAGNSTEVKRVWRLMKDRAPRLDSKNYLVMLEALKKLGDVDALRHCFEEWESQCVHYDARVLNVVLEAYLEKGFAEEARQLREKALMRGVLLSPE